MPRKPTDIVQYKLRIRESLRRRIEHAAKKRGLSANQEMAIRLEHSFELETVRKLEFLVEDLAKLTVRLKDLSERVTDNYRSIVELRKLYSAGNVPGLPSPTGEIPMQKSLLDRLSEDIFGPRVGKRKESEQEGE